MISVDFFHDYGPEMRAIAKTAMLGVGRFIYFRDEQMQKDQTKTKRVLDLG